MKRYSRLGQFGASMLIAISLGLTGNALAQDEATLNIGSEAPSIDIEHWVSDNDGEFPHVTKFEKDHIYIVEFWATWCGPCIAAMPHIAETQEKYADDKVQVISVSDEDLETVNEFLERKVRGQDEQTYAELTGTYCLTTDTDKSVKKDYFYAAKRTGIPCAFIVGKSGLIEWIGHPMAMDKPLAKIVNDEWDREEFAVEYKKEMEKRAKEAKIRRKRATAMRSVDKIMQDDGEEAAIAKLDELIMDEDLAEMKQVFVEMRIQLIVENQTEGAADALKTFAKENKSSPMLNELAWGLYERQVAEKDVPDDLLKAALSTAEIAEKSAPKNGAVLDTLAHLVYLVEKDIDRAIEVQKKAVKNAGNQIDDIQPFLDQLEKEKADAKK